MVEIYRDKAGEWRFRVRGENGEIVAQGEGYTRKASALRGVETLRRILSGPPRVEINDIEPRDFDAQNIHTQTVYVYKDVRYRVLRYSAAHLIQFEGQWRPSVEYVLAEPVDQASRDLHFYRADIEFALRFKREE